MSELETVTLQVEVPESEAARDIAKAVSARHSVAHKYVMWLRRKYPHATPAEVIQTLERHYVTSIAAVGAAISVGAIAADVGIAMIPVAGAAAAGVKSTGKQAAKKGGVVAARAVTKAATKAAAKNVALGASKKGAQKAAALLPAGDQQLQFEITAVFGLALAEIHSMELDRDQAHALVYGLSNGRVSQRMIATMATDIATGSSASAAGASSAANRGKWATTLANALPGGEAQRLIRTIQTGELDTVRASLSEKQQAAIDYGVSALAGGVASFVFGREVIDAARSAFAEAPNIFPAHLAVQTKHHFHAEDLEFESNRAVIALKQGAKATGNWMVGAAGVVGGGVARGATAVGGGVVKGATVVGGGVAKGVKKTIRGAGAISESVAGKLRKKKAQNPVTWEDQNGSPPLPT